MKRVLQVVMCAAVCLSAPVSAVNAAVYSYPDQSGTNVMYTGISEDTFSSASPAFDAPAINGDTLDFDPLAFAATASSATGNSQSNTVEAELSFTVMTNSTSVGISEVTIAEAGDYSLIGLGSASATASVTAPVEYEITHENGIALGGSAVSGTGTLVFSPAGSFSLPGDSGTGVRWTGGLTVDIASLAAANGIQGLVTKVNFSVRNAVTASGEDGGSAVMAKKDFSAVAVTIPEPSSGLIASASLLLFLVFRRRKIRNRK